MEFIKKRFKKPSSDFVFLLLMFVIAIVSVICLFYIFLDREEKVFDSDSEVFGTKISQSVYGDNSQIISKKAQKQIETAFFQISENENSQIKKVVDSKKSWNNVSPGVFNILKKCLDVAISSRGAFDFIGSKYNSLRLNEDNLRVRLIDDGSNFDFKEIKSGLSCMLAINQYKKGGAYAGIINVENAFGVFGEKKDGKLFKIPVYSKERVLIGNLEFREGVCCARYFPENQDFISINVIHKDGILSDALSKVCTLVSKEEAFSLLEKYDASAVFLEKDKKITFTKNFSSEFLILDESFKKN